MRDAGALLEREAGHILVSLILIVLDAARIHFATGVLARSMIGTKTTGPPR